MFSTAAIYTVYDLKAEVNEARNTIEISWEKDGAYDYPEVTVRRYRTTAGGDIFENETSYLLAATTTSYALSVPLISKDKVRSGEAVSEVYGYEISVTAHNTAGNVKTGPIWIYNIPGMKTVGKGWPVPDTKEYPSNTVRIISGDMSEIPTADVGEDTDGKNFVLTRNVSLTSWIPRGTGADVFQGNFYVNGHTVTINSINTAEDMGLFGMVDGLVRDLTVDYKTQEVSLSSDISFGAIAGTAKGEAKLHNVLVTGGFSLKMTADKNIHAGGIVGLMNDDAELINSYGGLSLTVEKPDPEHDEAYVHAGGVVGSTDISPITIKNVSIEENITVGSKTKPVSAGIEVRITIHLNTKYANT